MKTKIIYSGILPPKGFIAMCLWPVIFVRKDKAARYKEKTDNHEHIHAAQQQEMFFLGLVLSAFFYPIIKAWAMFFVVIFFLWYGVEWLVRLGIYGSTHDAYRNIGFEREAYANDDNLDYLKTRRMFAWVRYLFGRSTRLVV